MLIICEFKMHVNITYDQISIYPSKVHMVSYTSYIKLISNHLAPLVITIVYSMIVCFDKPQCPKHKEPLVYICKDNNCKCSTRLCSQCAQAHHQGANLD